MKKAVAFLVAFVLLFSLTAISTAAEPDVLIEESATNYNAESNVAPTENQIPNYSLNDMPIDNSLLNNLTLAPPKNFRVEENESYGVRLHWEYVPTYFDGVFIDGTIIYEIYRADSLNGYYSLLSSVNTSTSYLDVDIEGGNTYYYKSRIFFTANDGRIVYGDFTSPIKCTPVGISAPIFKKYVYNVWNLTLYFTRPESSIIEVYRSAHTPDNFIKISDGLHVGSGDLEISDLSALPNTYYYYKIRAKSTTNLYGQFSDVVEVYTGIPTPEGVDVDINNLSNPALAEIIFKWDEPIDASSFLSYELWRSENNKDFELNKYGLMYSCITYDNNFKPGNTYKYKIRFYYTIGSKKHFGEFFQVTEAITIPSGNLEAPKNFKAKAYSGGKIRLTWKETSGASGYYIYSAPSKTGKYTLIKTVGASATSYTNSKLVGGKVYYYKIIPYHTVGTIKHKGTTAGPVFARATK